MGICLTGVGCATAPGGVTAGRTSALENAPALENASRPGTAAADTTPRQDAASAAQEAQPRQRTWADAIIYFVIVDRFADGDTSTNVQVDPSQPGSFHGGDLEGLLEHLDEIADLGVTALWITPVVRNIPDFVTGAGFPDWAYHGYWADDFESLDPRFGTEAELAALAKACHERGIALLLDVVYNHVGYGSHYLDDPATRGWLRVGSACGDDDVTTCVAGLPDLKTELPEVADYLMSAHLGLASRVGLDGFRLDTVKHVGHEMWRQHRARVRRELGDDFFLLGEVWGGDAKVLDPWFEDDELDAGFDFSFAGSVLAWIQGRGRTVAFDRYLTRRHQVRPGHFLAHYLSSHDVPTALYRLDGDTVAYRLAVMLQMTTFGLPVLYYGEEVGRLGGDWPANRSDMPWGARDILPGAGIPRDEALRADIQRMIAIRRRHPALSRGSHQPLSTDGDLLVFARQLEPADDASAVDATLRDNTISEDTISEDTISGDPTSGDRVVVAINRGTTEAVVSLATADLLPEGWQGGTLVDVWNESELEVDDAEVVLHVAPRSARIIVAQRP